MRRVAALAAAIGLVASACAANPSIRSERDRVTVAVLGGFSGGEPKVADGIAKGVAVAVDEYNGTSDARYEARVRRVDTAGTEEGARSAAQRVTALELLIGAVGPFTLGEAVGSGPILDQAGIAFVLPSVTDVSLSQHGWRGSRRLVSDDRQEGRAVAEGANAMVARGTGAKIDLFSDGGPVANIFFQGASAVLGERKSLGVSGTLPQGDLKQFAAGAVNDAPRAVIYSGAAGRGASLINELRAQGFRGRFIGSHEMKQDEFARTAGAASEGALVSCTCSDTRDPKLDRFRTAYSARFGKPPPEYAAEAYDGAMMLLESIQEVDPRSETVAALLRSARSFLGDTKLYVFDADGVLQTEAIWLDQMRDGRWVFLKRAEGPA